ncbi:MAG: AMP-binding protein, partial [Psychrosphaera sp.]|nr:AMP-binding protein [Psychrosphaera sp.]
YTSGSTVQPKGVLTEHRALMNFGAGFCAQTDLCTNTLESGWLWLSSFIFDASLKGLYLMATGVKLIIPTAKAAGSPQDIVELVKAHKVGVINTTPQLLELIVKTPGLPNVDLISSGEGIGQRNFSLFQQFAQRAKTHFINAYGPTETTVNSSYAVLTEASQEAMGRPVGNTEFYVLNNDLTLAPKGAVGELYVGGDGLARGYLNRPELTAQYFIENPFIKRPSDMSSASRLYRTGDLVRYLDDNNLEYVGRADDQVKIRGFRIELGEIQARMEQLDTVDSALVMAKTLAGSTQLVGYIKPVDVTTQDSSVLIKTVTETLKIQLPDYMVPAMIMVVDHWPLTPTGKVDKKALPAPDGSSLQGEYIAPQTPTEQVLVDIWAGLLNVEAEKISTTANFFDLGGHSLMIIRLGCKISNRCGVEVSVQSIFDNAILQDLAMVVEQGSKATKRPPLVAVERDSDTDTYIVPVSFAQQRLWFIDSLQGGSPQYNMPMVLEVSGQLDTTLVRDVFNTIIERHQVLRTVYLEEGGQTLQRICDMADIDFAIKLENLTHLSGQALDSQVKALVGADLAKAFDLASDLMLRVCYIKQSADTGVLIFNMHHIASDGWSMAVLTKEFFTLYTAYSQCPDKQRPNPLAPLAIQYADFAQWQHQYLEGEVLEAQLNYWTAQLEELPAVHALALDYARPQNKQHEGAIVSGKLPATTAQLLLGVAKQHKLTPFMLLHGALSLLLSRHSNSDDIDIGTQVANRLEADLEPLIGFFVNTLVLRADTNHHNLTDYFAAIRQVHLDAQTHQDVPFEQLVERLKAPRSTAHSPLFQIMMVFDSDYGLDNDSDTVSTTLPGVDIKGYQSGLVQEKFDLTIGVSLSQQGVGLNWSYDVSIFSAAHIEQLNEHLCRLLEGLSQDQALAPHRLPMLSGDEMTHLLGDLNDTAMDYPKDLCIHQLFEQQVVAHPDKVALSYRNLQLTYGQLNNKANQLAHFLQTQHGVKPDTLVGLCVERSLEMVIGILGILKAGGAYVPLDPSYPQERLHYMLDNSKLTAVLSQSQVADVLAGFSGTVLTLDGLGEGDDHLCSEYGTNNLATSQIGLSSSNLAYVIYTSGSTGQPKGVTLEHQSAMNYLTCAKDYLTDDIEFSVMSTSLNFDATVTSLFGAWLGGGYLTLLDEGLGIFDALADLMSSDQAGLFKVTPAHLLGLHFDQPILTTHVVVVGG